MRQSRHWVYSDEETKQADHCPLCGRVLGTRVEKHHLVPRSKGGTETVSLHPICHRKIHALFNEKELARHYSTIEALLAAEEIRAFVQWVARKPPDFFRRTSKKSRN